MNKGRYKISSGRILVLHGDGDSVFEEAHFIVKEGDEPDGESIVKEADRIICEYSEKKVRRRCDESTSRSWKFFTLGTLIGFAVCFLSFIIFNLVS